MGEQFQAYEKAKEEGQSLLSEEKMVYGGGGRGGTGGPGQGHDGKERTEIRGSNTMDGCEGQRKVKEIHRISARSR